MQIYLPTAEISVNAFLILGMGGAVGFLSGMFGVGGGFLMTPFLIFIGIPSPIAVATGANQLVASSVSGVIAHWRRDNVDIPMGLALLAGGLIGSTLGVWVFTVLRSIGQVDLVIKLSYVAMLGIVGTLMLIESMRTLLRNRRSLPPRKRHRHYWVHGLPLKVRFRRSQLYISVLLPIAMGLVVGLLVAIMGVGGGFILVPAMIYILGMPTAIVVGTSLFQMIFVTANVTILQAVASQAVDIVLAMILLIGAVIGAQVGARVSARLHGEQIRGLLALIVLAVAINLCYDLVAPPRDLFSLGEFRDRK